MAMASSTTAARRVALPRLPVDCNNGLDNDGDKLVDDGCPETGGQCGNDLDDDGDAVADDGCFPPNESGGSCSNWLDDDADGRINDGCTPTKPAAIARANDTDGILRRISPFFPGAGDITCSPNCFVPGTGNATRSAVVVTFTAIGADCTGTDLVLSGAELLDVNGEPATVTTVNSRVGIASTADCDSDGDANTVDNCPFISNGAQENSDADFIDNPAPLTQDDETRAKSDVYGDACDTDDDNDGLLDTVETGLPGAACASATAALNPINGDTDGDATLDSAECAIGTNPNLAASKPTAGAVRDCGRCSGGLNGHRW